ncbi:MAG: hypothetical protein AAB887_00580 [Patescibacteria group bacterium]
MIVLMIILVFFDAFFLPAKNLFSNLIFVLILGLGIWKIHYYKNWFMLSLVFITAAVVFYLIGSESANEVIVQKFSDWTLISLLLGALRLIKLPNDKNRI